MSKIIAMIPARLGSQRVPKKNLRFINDKPLIAYAIEAAKASGVFDEIYVNSEADIFGDIAYDFGVKFYKRSKELASDSAINDDFAYDFIKNVEGDILVQLLPTAPLISPAEIKGFVNEMVNKKLDTLVSVENHKIACVHAGQPVNFKLLEPHKPSQTMEPVQSYLTVLMAWTYENFTCNMEKHGFAYHGADSKIGYYTIKGLSVIDIDTEEDFSLAEVALFYRDNPQKFKPRYYDLHKDQLRSEIDVFGILKKDGIINNELEDANKVIVNLKKIINSQNNKRSWSKRIVNTENNSATLISQLPGEGNRRHHHNDWNEWWYIVCGQWQFEIEEEEKTVKEGDVVFIEKNKWHKITASGSEPAVRLAVSKDKVPHIYKELGVKSHKL